jgi:hypothetical protein|nr:MAG TPA: hypothetical protein [Bacteriophage sp.]
MKKKEVSDYDKLSKGIKKGIAGLNKKGIISWVIDLMYDLNEEFDVDAIIDKFSVYRENALRKFPRQPNT